MVIAIARRAALMAVIFVIPAILYFVSDLKTATGILGFRSLTGKAEATLTPVLNYFWPLDLATGLICVLILIIGSARRWFTIPFQAMLALAAFLVLFLILPHGLKGTYDLDTRFIVMAAAFLPAAIVPLPSRSRAQSAIFGLLAALFLVRMTIVTVVWNDWSADLAGFRRVIASVKPGDVVLTVRLPRPTPPSRWLTLANARSLSDGTVLDGHLAALLVIEHRAWWPFLFDNPSQQPIETKEPFHTLTELVDASHDPIASLAWGVPVMRLVTHVLVMGTAPGPGRIDTEGLTRVAGNATAVLFSVDSAPR